MSRFRPPVYPPTLSVTPAAAAADVSVGAQVASCDVKGKPRQFEREMLFSKVAKVSDVAKQLSEANKVLRTTSPHTFAIRDVCHAYPVSFLPVLETAAAVTAEGEEKRREEKKWLG